MDLGRYSRTLHAHDFTPGGNSRVVMIRKKDQRTFASATNEPKFETLTKETVQTFRGNKIERKITSQKRDLEETQKDLLDKFSFISIHGTGVCCGKSSTGSGTTPRKSSVRKKSETFVVQPTAADRFATECLEAHNRFRELHKAPPLKLSKKLCKVSEEWARHLAAKGEMQHRPDCSYGENLFQIWSPGLTLTGAEPVECWYQEIEDHVFHQEPSTLKTGHFTQVVWLESQELGVGVAKSKTGQMFVVANYDPPGNFIGSFAENVPPLGGFAETPKSLASEVKNDDKFQDEMLKLHNEYRAKHGAPPLKLNKDLSNYAQEWAVFLARENRFEHRPRNPHGENIFCLTSSQVATAKDAVTTWYSESKNYHYGIEPKVLNSGHFTQMIWRESKEVGVGRAKSRSGKVMIVANYRPRGNIVGQFAANVQRPIH
ncbi:hypothetical protein AAG570_004343 [Ranatra chinensis]|uniref:SCP domain-containing protein n=1 Tax=Ranatra chinensis TaxID=642074 RepID=A0ABD0Y235_9HEMI